MLYCGILQQLLVYSVVLSYMVIVMNNNTSEVIVSDTTNNTIYPLPVIKSCQYYTANVTAFSSQHHSESVVTGQRTPGGEYMMSMKEPSLTFLFFILEYYDLVSVLRPIVISCNTIHCTVNISTNIHKVS